MVLFVLPFIVETLTLLHLVPSLEVKRIRTRTGIHMEIVLRSTEEISHGFAS